MPPSVPANARGKSVSAARRGLSGTDHHALVLCVTASSEIFKAALKKLLRRSRDGVQYVEHDVGDGERSFAAACKLGLEGIVSKLVDAPYKSGPARSWLKVRNPKAPAATRREDGTF